MFGEVCQVLSLSSFSRDVKTEYKTGHKDFSFDLSPINNSSNPFAQYSLTEVTAYAEGKMLTEIWFKLSYPTSLCKKLSISLS